MAKKSPLILILLALLLFSCAKQVAPGGGPKDTEPPTVIVTNPLNGTVNFNGNEIDVTFSEYIDKSSVRNSIFFSPEIERFKLNWSGKILEIIVLDSLKKNTTYTVTLGTGISDLNEKNKMAEAFSLVFSTGNKIDKGEISGTVFNRKPDGVMIFAYKQTADTIPNPSTQKPDYTTQCGKNGFYSLTGLAAARYFLFAVRDENANKLYDENEAIGITSKELNLTTDSSKLANVNFMLTRYDTTRPELEEITMTDENHILLEFSKVIDSSKLYPKNFFIFDSTNGKKYPVKFAYKGKVKKNKALISFSKLDTENGKLFLFVGNVYDKFGNASTPSSRKIYFNSNPDTLKPKLLKYGNLLGEKQIDFRKPVIRLLFDDGVNLNSKAVKFENKKGKGFGLTIARINDAEFLLTVKQKLKSNEDYLMKIDFSKFSDAAGNYTDSVFVYPIKTTNELDYVTVEGKIDGARNKLVIANLLRLKDNLILQTKTKKDCKFYFRSVSPGKYFIWAFVDKNKNGKYDYGKLIPFQYSETFTFRSDTLNVRPRWPIKNVNLTFQN